MFFRKIFLTALCFAAFGFAPTLAETIIDLDIVADTTWTKEMSPIIIKSNARNDRIRWVASGAVLTIEPGVEVQFDPDMSLHIASQCLRSYGSDTCYRDADDNIKMPKLIARGTSVEPIVFTSSSQSPVAGEWGAVVIEAPNSEIEWAEFRYGGMKGKRAFVEINNSLFENNLIEQGGIADYALYASSQDIVGNVIRENGGDGVYCEYQCEIKENFFENNAGNAIDLDINLITKIHDNFFYKNGSTAIFSDSIYSQAVEVENNFFRENGGGVYFHRSSPELKIDYNNFLKNKDYAIMSDINNRAGQIYDVIGNWFGIDTGSKTTNGEFFVSTDFNASEFAANGNDFSITGGSKAARSYRDYLSDNNLESAYFVAKVKRKAIIGNENKAGSLLLYSVTLENQTTKASGAELKVTPPGDQLLLLCSAQSATEDASYSIGNACTTTLASDIEFKNNRLVWTPQGIPALDEKTFYFVMATNPATQSPSFPRLDFNGKPFSYRLGASVELKETGGASTVTDTNTNTNTEETSETETVAEEAEESVVEEAAPSSPSSTVVEADGALAVGTVSRQIIGGVLNYVLSTPDGKHYSLYNKWKWREVDDFTKGADKAKTIAVYGDFYYNRYGAATGIKFTRFEIR